MNFAINFLEAQMVTAGVTFICWIWKMIEKEKEKRKRVYMWKKHNFLSSLRVT